MKNRLFLALLCVFMFTSASCTKDVYEIKNYKNEVSYDEYDENLSELTKEYSFEAGKDYLVTYESYSETIITKIEGDKQEITDTIYSNSYKEIFCDFDNEILHIKGSYTENNNEKEEIVESDKYIIEKGNSILEIDALEETYRKYKISEDNIFGSKQDFNYKAALNYGYPSENLNNSGTKYYIDNKVYTCVYESNKLREDMYGKYEYDDFYIFQNRYSSIVEIIVCQDTTTTQFFDNYKIVRKNIFKRKKIIKYSDVNLKEIDISDFEYIDK